MLRQKYVAGIHCHPIYMITIYTVHNNYSSAWIIHYKINFPQQENVGERYGISQVNFPGLHRSFAW